MNNNFNIDDLISEDKNKITPSKKIGAPKKSVKRDQKLMVYITQEELSQIEKEAENLGLSKASFVRKAILSYFV